MTRWTPAFLVLVALFSGSASAGDDPLEAFRGSISQDLLVLRHTAPGSPADAEEVILARGAFALPYLVEAAEGTRDEGYRARLLRLIARIRAVVPPAECAPGEEEEYPAYDATAMSQMRQCLIPRHSPEEPAPEPGSLEAEFVRIRGSDDPVAKRVERLLEFADRHPRTNAARRALTNVAFHLSGPNLVRRGEDPLSRLQRLAQVAARLSSGEFPGSEAPAKAVEEIASFFVSSSSPPPKESAKVMLDAFRIFFRHHFLTERIDGRGQTVPYYLIDKLGDCHRALGVSEEALPAVLDAELERLEQALPEKAAIRYLRATRDAALGRRREALAALERLETEFADRLHGRKALAARACLLHAAGDFAGAETLFTRYVARHPESTYAWVAALRIGHCRALTGRWAEAIKAYDRAMAGAPEHPLITELALAARGRALEELERGEEAVDSYVAALNEWAGGAERQWGTPLQGVPVARRPGYDPDAALLPEQLEARVSALKRSDAPPRELAGYLRGRRLQERGLLERATAVWEKLLRENPDSPLAAETRAALAEVDLTQALAAKTRERAEALLSRAEGRDDAFSRFAAGLFRACLLLGSSDSEAEELLGRRFEEFEKAQRVREPEDGLESDVAAIRRAAFLPRKPTFFLGEWAPQRGHEYVVADPEIKVNLVDGSPVRVTIRHALPDVPGALWLTRSEVEWVARIMDGLGGTGRTKSRSLMAIPQPAGRSKAIADLLNLFLQVVPGHWGGWHLQTYPILQEITFLDAERTKARVDFRVRYQGGEALLEKRDGAWILGEAKLTWIE